jgi:hypothetical protein
MPKLQSTSWPEASTPHSQAATIDPHLNSVRTAENYQAAD